MLKPQVNAHRVQTISMYMPEMYVMNGIPPENAERALCNKTGMLYWCCSFQGILIIGGQDMRWLQVPDPRM
jgi:hypothetical protein